MAIVDDDVRRVRDEADIVRLITQHTQLKKMRFRDRHITRVVFFVTF